FGQLKIAGLLMRDDNGEREAEAGSEQTRMQPRLVERGERDVRRVDDARLPLVREPDQPVIKILRQVMLAVHVQQRAGPDFAFGELIAERLDPERLDEKKIQP